MMGVPSRLQSVAEVVETCRWWKPVRIPDRRGWVNRYGLCECTKPSWCEYNTTDARVGGCVICSNVAKVSKEKRP
jgi:hypothetical protein